jgi:predicted DNA-binding transcriptional regulator YafY
LWLADWREVKRVPVFVSVHPTAQRLIVAAGQQEMLTLRYWGGSTPGAERKVSPTLVFQVGGYGPLYLCGYCHVRRAERVFRVERVELLPETGDIICITE